MKKFLALAMAGSMAFSLAACGNSASTSASASDSASTATSSATSEEAAVSEITGIAQVCAGPARGLVTALKAVADEKDAA